MNVIVSNRQKEIIDNANIDAIKDLNGLFNVDDLINKFKNYFFSKMILDATSVVNFASKEVLGTLADEIGAEKLIILLPANPEPPMEFKKLLIDLKIYNFTNKIEDVVKFIDRPNTYEDAIRTVDDSFGNNMYVDNSIKEENNNVPTSSSSGKSLGDMLSNFDLNNSSDMNQSISHNYSKNDDSIPEVRAETDKNEEPEDYGYSVNSEGELRMGTDPDKNTFLISGSIPDNDEYYEKNSNKIIIGVKNVTLHAGSTSLIYMMHRVASSTLNKKVLSIEIDKKDFKFYRDSKMISVEAKNVDSVVESSNEELIFVDLNEYNDTSFCTAVLYLVEPSTIKLNKLMIENKDIFKDLRDKKVIINKSLLSESDIRTLSSEASMDFFFNIEPLNDRIMNDAIVNLLELLDIK